MKSKLGNAVMQIESPGSSFAFPKSNLFS